MPIGEKTVEINVSTELMNYLFRRTGRTYVALAPTQREEGRLGYDVGYYGGGWACLIQYKRAYRDRRRWEWRLNRNKRRDQHQILQRLESAGIPVYYALPFFSEPGEVIKKRIQLLNNVFWFRPSYIRPVGGATGHHEVRYDEVTATWSVHSAHEGLVVRPDSLGEFLGRTLDGDVSESLEGLVGRLNEILSAPDDVPEAPAVRDERGDAEVDGEDVPDALGQGQYLVVGADG